ncbi:hypothetical protein BATDEDRAFT_91567 [Batrachochytrium dendrobatidis JAM81]|uniref:Uncharacterized protein n=2 Tax=Batrachochytrium dendrobatidis TaxID=109871 RepID=F4PAM1_BATDJ|nr:uncharacterized protein BATDEDRAFT_91567 [Batrachochytrium dendrobatidis JAM81]EGF77565.1 hypothetical protein BATDEDRAFT_91567 [Batrachochytrium dendrobatidis JAM81]KAJ8323523.1 hypothetical protein O5D80_007836 [Batrachochytrium dendrobatidis]OAJ43284.1 hypothetical protein BDEG_26656 [Batrachochytrium dendrobatidis JEL423]|eukprot:XP_006681759.1 hypothetical protein BATDEDRAFT_91567 [Batrachochytrium dendrobatidis JAM81]
MDSSSQGESHAGSTEATDCMFLELDRVRKMQAELSLTHLAQARQFPTSLGEDDKDEDAMQTYKRNNEYVNDKEDKVKILVERLNELTSIIDKSAVANMPAPSKPSNGTNT